MVLPESDRLRVGGTIWNGEAVIASTMRIEWNFAPIASVAELSFSADFRMTGGGTDLAGLATKAGSSFRFRNVSGQLDDGMLAAFAPNLPVDCRFLAEVDFERLVLGGASQMAEGSLRLSPATCFLKVGASPAAELPASTFSIAPNATTSAGSTTAIGTRERLLEVRLAPNGALSLWPTAAAVRYVPFFAGLRYDTKIE